MGRDIQIRTKVKTPGIDLFLAHTLQVFVYCIFILVYSFWVLSFEACHLRPISMVPSSGYTLIEFHDRILNFQIS